ncbi:uncharacterized protein JCM10292_004961 [Rhodotorula paludigena]|uniref:uncharacterized protein n=1 Tax=Rhodotorula paludigena TaxID=86838 RepID=UPI00317F671D
MAPAPPPPPPRSTAATSPPPPPPPPRTTSPAAAFPSSPDLSRPSTPSGSATPRGGGGVASAKGTLVSLPALLSDLSVLASSPGAPLLAAKHFAPEPAPEDAYAPPKPGAVDPRKRGNELLEAVRAGELDLRGSREEGEEDGEKATLTREEAPLLAERWVEAVDRVLQRAEEEDKRAGTKDGAVERAEQVERWAGKVERGLAKA